MHFDFNYDPADEHRQVSGVLTDAIQEFFVKVWCEDALAHTPMPEQDRRKYVGDVARLYGSLTDYLEPIHEENVEQLEAVIKTVDTSVISYLRAILVGDVPTITKHAAEIKLLLKRALIARNSEKLDIPKTLREYTNKLKSIVVDRYKNPVPHAVQHEPIL